MTATPTFRVECLIRRKNGTHPLMWPTDKYPDGKTYHFVPSAGDDRHIAEVDDMAHLSRFLQITEAYRIVEAPAPVMAVEPATGTEGGQAGGGASLPNPDSVLPQVPPVAPVPAAGTPAIGVEIDPEDSLPVDLAALREIFETEVGRKPHPSAKRESMVAQIKLVRETPVVAPVTTE